MATHEKIHIIGIGDDGLDGITAQARRLIEEADLVLGAESTLKLLPKSAAANSESPSGRISTKPSSKSSKSGNKKVVVLASGDPLFYGVARYLVRQAGQRPLRSRAARQQHAVGVCPRERKLGRCLPDESGHASAGLG